MDSETASESGQGSSPFDVADRVIAAWEADGEEGKQGMVDTISVLAHTERLKAAGILEGGPVADPIATYILHGYFRGRGYNADTSPDTLQHVLASLDGSQP